MPTKPISLRPMSREQTLWMWGGTIFFAGLLMVGWYFTVGRVVGQHLGMVKDEIGQGIAVTQKTVDDNKGPVVQITSTVDKLKQQVHDNAIVLTKKKMIDDAIAKQVAEDLKSNSVSTSKK